MSAVNVRKVGYLCIQGRPSRICSGCTSACSEPIYVEDETTCDER